MPPALPDDFPNPAEILPMPARRTLPASAIDQFITADQRLNRAVRLDRAAEIADAKADTSRDPMDAAELRRLAGACRALAGRDREKADILAVAGGAK